VIIVSYLTERVIAASHWDAVAADVLVPRLHGTGTITLPAGIVGATVNNAGGV